MKFALLFLLFLLAGCESYADPYAQLEAANAAIAGTRSAQAQQRQYELEQERQEEAASLATAGAAEIEIERMNAASYATQTAISNEQEQIQLAVLAEQSTRSAWEYDLAATQTVMAYHVTATVMPLLVTQAAAEAQGAQDRAHAWPMVILALAAVVVAIGLMIIKWLAARMLVDLDHRRMQTAVYSRQHATVDTKNGTVLFEKPEAIIDNSTEKIYPDLNAQDSQAMQPMPVMPIPNQRTTDELRAIRLLADSEAIEGAASRTIPRWDKLPGWSSARRATVVDWLCQRFAISVTNTGTTFETETLASARWKITAGLAASPTQEPY